MLRRKVNAQIVLSQMNRYNGGTHFKEYFNNSGNPYSGGTEYQGGLHLNK